MTRRADVDVEDFSATTLRLLNLVISIHSQGTTPESIRELMAQGQDPAAIERLWHDLLTLRNEHLLAKVKEALPETSAVMVPWGAAHMPGLAESIEREGFKVTDRQKYRIVNFRAMWDRVRRGKTATAN